jgi:hypothetical protein
MPPEEEEGEVPGEGEEEVVPEEESTWEEQPAAAPPEHDPAPEEHALRVTAMASSGAAATLFARGRRIERMERADDAPTASVAPVLTLPAEGPDVIGLLDLDGRLVFSTEECVYELRGNLVLPLVEGIGGPLVAWGGGLVVCDARSGRLYHLSGPAFQPPKGTPR